MVQWRPSKNRGFYFGSSSDTSVNHDIAWKDYVQKMDRRDTIHPAVVEKREQQIRRGDDEHGASRRLLSAGSRPQSRRGSSARPVTTGRLRTGTSDPTRESVENLASALLLEQSQRLKKEKILEKLLLDESAARFKAEQTIRQLEGQIDHLFTALNSVKLEGTRQGHGNTKKSDMGNKSNATLASLRSTQKRSNSSMS